MKRTKKTKAIIVQVKQRTSNFNNYAMGSHVMQYGDTNITAEKLYLYQGFDPATVNFPPQNGRLETKMEVVNQRDAELFFMWQMVCLFSPQVNIYSNPSVDFSKSSFFSSDQNPCSNTITLLITSIHKIGFS